MLAAVAAASLDTEGFCSVKIMASYAEPIDAKLRASGPNSDAKGHLATLVCMFDSPTWIYVTRRSTIRQAISRVLCQKRGINHLLSRNDSDFRPGNAALVSTTQPLPYMPVTVPEVINGCVDILRENESWERFFSENLISPLRIVYEEIAGNADYIRIAGEKVGKMISEPSADRVLLRMSDLANEDAYSEFMRQYGWDIDSRLPTTP
jgi:LPS sulfotransferase NodH